jgi:hypothetical protein
MCLAALLSGCFESKEEQATEAYRTRDFAAARELARELADDGNPRGLELQALMAAQGLDRAVDFAEAVALIDRAVVIDPSFQASRRTILDRIAASGDVARTLFESGQYRRALVLAEALADYGDAEGGALARVLITGHYVALDGSDMSWLDFWNRCGGNTRSDDPGAMEIAFARDCAGRRAVWDGTVSGRKDARLFIRMQPGRPRGQHDLALELADPRDGMKRAPHGGKIRFAGVIAVRGEPRKPDVLREALVLGPAPLSEAEQGEVARRHRHAVVAACRKLTEVAYRANHMPDWAVNLQAQRASASRHEDAKSYAFYVMVDITSDGAAFSRRADGTWHGAYEGFVTLQSGNPRATEVLDFTAECEIDETFAKGSRPVDHGRMSFVALAEPKANATRASED